MTARRRRCVVSIMTLLIAAVAGEGWAFWTAAGVGQAAAGSGSLVAATLSTPAAAANSITVTWTQQASLTPSSSANGSITYSVERKLGTGSYVAVSTGGCSGTKPYGIASCVDAPGANGSYSYRVVASFATWTATSSASGPVSFVVDTTVPTVLSIDRVSATQTNATSVSWTVTFSEAVTGVNSADFALAATGPTGASISTVTGSGTTYTVTASTGTGSGTLGLNLVDDDTIIDAVTNQLGGTGTADGSLTGQTYTIDKTAPTVTSISRVGASLTNATSVSWTVTFSEAVTGVTSADFALVASGLTATSITAVAGSGTTYTVTASSGTGTPTGTLGLNLVDDDTIIDAVTNQLGGAGIANGDRTGEFYAIDRTPPTAPTPVTVTSGGNIWPTATCSEPAGVVSYVNAAGVTSVGVTATVAAPEAGETIVFTATRGATQTLTVAVGTPATLNLTSLDQGAITLSARAQDAVGNLSAPTAATGTVIKDTVAPAAPTANYADPLLGSPRVSGTSECSAAIVAVRVGRPQDVYPTTAGPTGSYSVDVSSSLLGLLAVQYSVTATDRAGNTGAAATT